MAEDERNKTTENGEPKTDQSGAITDFAETTSRVVQKAAAILEEEIAKGIIAAKQVEERLKNVSVLHEGNPVAMIEGFRKEAHEVAEMAMTEFNRKAMSVCIKLCEPICAISDYTIGISFFGLSVGTFTIKGQTNFFNCKDQEPLSNTPLTQTHGVS